MAVNILSGRVGMTAKPIYTMYLAVLPRYRSECIDLLRAETGSELRIYVSTAHLDPSVRTGIPTDYYSPVKMVRLWGGRAFVQLGHWGAVLSAQTAILDLNPRSITSVILLTARKLLGRRTLLWGHLYPQAGGGSKTAWLRSLMRKLSAGTILYTYSNLDRAIRDMPNSNVWVAPNSLYKLSDIGPAHGEDPRNAVLYVGRFEPAKKLPLLIKGFSQFALAHPGARLVLVGDGSEVQVLRSLVHELGIEAQVVFTGWVDDAGDLRRLFGTAFCSVSPGFAGLGLTQSLGFGIPMAVARNEPHSPEIELEASGGVAWFPSDDPLALSSTLAGLWARRDRLPSETISSHVASRYSAEAMAGGLLAALKDQDQNRLIEQTR